MARVKIVSFSVLQNAVSVRLLCENANWLVNEARDERRKVSIDDVTFEAKIRSINIQREGASLLLRTKRSRFIVGRLYDLMDKGSNEFMVSESIGRKLSHLLDKVSKKTGEPEENLLFRLTSFKKDGNEILGKKSIEELSENQKVVVLRKLNSMLQREFAKCSIS